MTDPDKFEAEYAQIQADMKAQIAALNRGGNEE